MRKLWIGLALGGLLLAGCGQKSGEVETLPEPAPAPTPAESPGEKTPSTMPADHAGMTAEEHAKMAGAGHEAAGATADAADVCPVEHGQIKGKESYADHNGKRYYFCCSGCTKKFLENADQIIADNPEWAAKWSEKIPG